MLKTKPHLTAFSLPEDGRRWVPLGAAEEGYGSSRGRNLVPGPDYNLGRHCRETQMDVIIVMVVILGQQKHL